MTTTKLRPAVKWHGGKNYLARRIVGLLPPHERYVEPYAGGLSVLLNKPPVPVEVAGDLDVGLIGFYRVLTARTAELMDRLDALEYRAETFEWASRPGPENDPLNAAVRFIVRHRFSRGGLGKTFAWSERLRGGRPGDLNAWETIKGQLPAIATRLREVRLECRSALAAIREHDGPGTLFYLDPPYPHATRTATGTYRHEMTPDDHAELLELASHTGGMVAISGYAYPLYDRALARWDRHEFDMPNHSGQTRTKERRMEVLWIKTAGRPRARERLSHEVSRDLFGLTECENGR
jgi:DNA adenine methylase